MSKLATLQFVGFYKSMAGDRRFVGIPRQQIPDLWREIERYVCRALERGRGEYLPSDVFDALVRDRMQLWLAVHDVNTDGILVTEIAHYPEYKTCVLRLAAGIDAPEWFPALKTVEEWARNMGCRAMEVYGRAGWKRIMKDYEQTHVVMRKTL